ncbi:MAG: hypothetical protein V4591_01400 [Bdellovibrionota bacterium]
MAGIVASVGGFIARKAIASVVKNLNSKQAQTWKDYTGSVIKVITNNQSELFPESKTLNDSLGILFLENASSLDEGKKNATPMHLALRRIHNASRFVTGHKEKIDFIISQLKLLQTKLEALHFILEDIKSNVENSRTKSSVNKFQEANDNLHRSAARLQQSMEEYGKARLTIQGPSDKVYSLKLSISSMKTQLASVGRRDDQNESEFSNLGEAKVKRKELISREKRALASAEETLSEVRSQILKCKSVMQKEYINFIEAKERWEQSKNDCLRDLGGALREDLRRNLSESVQAVSESLSNLQETCTSTLARRLGDLVYSPGSVEGGDSLTGSQLKELLKKPFKELQKSYSMSSLLQKIGSGSVEEQVYASSFSRYIRGNRPEFCAWLISEFLTPEGGFDSEKFKEKALNGADSADRVVEFFGVVFNELLKNSKYFEIVAQKVFFHFEEAVQDLEQAQSDVFLYAQQSKTDYENAKAELSAATQSHNDALSEATDKSDCAMEQLNASVVEAKQKFDLAEKKYLESQEQLKLLKERYVDSFKATGIAESAFFDTFVERFKGRVPNWILKRREGVKNREKKTAAAAAGAAVTAFEVEAKFLEQNLLNPKVKVVPKEILVAYRNAEKRVLELCDLGHFNNNIDEWNKFKETQEKFDPNVSPELGNKLTLHEQMNSLRRVKPSGEAASVAVDSQVLARKVLRIYNERSYLGCHGHNLYIGNKMIEGLESQIESLRFRIIFLGSIPVEEENINEIIEELRDVIQVSIESGESADKYKERLEMLRKFNSRAVRQAEVERLQAQIVKLSGNLDALKSTSLSQSNDNVVAKEELEDALKNVQDKLSKRPDSRWLKLEQLHREELDNLQSSVV